MMPQNQNCGHITHEVYSNQKGCQFQALWCRSTQFNLLPVLPGRLIHSGATPWVVIRLGASTSATTAVRCIPPGFGIAPAPFRLVFDCRRAICAMRSRCPGFRNYIKRLLRLLSPCCTPRRVSARWGRSHARCSTPVAVRRGRGRSTGLRLLHRNLQRQA